jgi:hypothetical protein
MALGSVKNGNASRTNRTFERVQQRLKGMEDQAFVRLNCDSTFSPLGTPVDSWSQEEIEAAVKRAPDLATDPAKGNKITDGGIEEAAVALTAEHQMLFSFATRESTGSAEFIDDKGIAWDVKSPLSPPPDQNWQFSPDHQLVKVRHDLAQGDQVLFNLSRVNDKDRDDTLSLFAHQLTCEERGKIVILTDPEIVNAHF